MRSLPKSPRLRRILAAYTVNQLGTWFGYVALSIGVYDHTHSALAVAGLFVAARLLPALLAPALLARAEISERAGQLSRLYFVEAIATSALALLLHHFWLPGILGLVAIDGAAALAAGGLLRTAAARTAVQELDRELDPAERPAPDDGEDEAVEVAQRKANAALNFAFTATVATGPAVAGAFTAVAGSSTALLLDACSFLACGVLLIDVRSRVDAGEGASVGARLRAAWRHLQATPTLRALLLAEAVAVVFFASVEPVEVLYAKATLHAGDGGFGLLLAVWGAGMVLGGIVFARSVHRPLGPMLVAGTLGVGLSYLGLAAAPTLALACGASIVGGLGNGVQWASLISAVQQLTPPTLLGRLMGAVESIGALCPAIGFSLGGVVTALTSPRGALLIAGVGATAMTAVFLRIGIPVGATTGEHDGSLTLDAATQEIASEGVAPQVG